MSILDIVNPMWYLGNSNVFFIYLFVCLFFWGGGFLLPHNEVLKIHQLV